MRVMEFFFLQNVRFVLLCIWKFKKTSRLRPGMNWESVLNTAEREGYI